MRKKRFIISIDFGATYVKLAKVRLNGAVCDKASFSTGAFRTKERLISEMAGRAASLIGPSRPETLGIGIGVPGPVDYKRGLIYNLTNVKGWRNVALRDIMIERLKLPACVDNDANAACMGEMEWGAAKGYRNVVCVTLGSGVGGGIAIDGKIYHGRSYSAGEIGHICIDKDGARCNCGGRGCMETFAGNRYIIKDVTDRLKRHKGSLILSLAGGKASGITPEIIDMAARRNDRLALETWKRTGRSIGIGLSSLINILNPEIIVIGGGVSKAGRPLFDAIREAIRDRAMDIFVKGLKVTRAKFVEDAGIVGAAALVKKELSGK